MKTFKKTCGCILVILDADKTEELDGRGVKIYQENFSPWEVVVLVLSSGRIIANLGIKTYIGTEIPLVIPTQFINQLKGKLN
jgi:hypothetical protein